ncbi:MAG: leucine-rich repeat domain-containing protein [Acutalibacteraceae bacterium]
MKKKKNIIVFLAFFVAIAISFTTFGTYTFTSNRDAYKDTEDGCGLYRYKSTSTQTVFDVPDTYGDKPVTDLMAFSLANSAYLKELNLGKNIKTIDVWALTNCPVLESINVNEDNPYFTSVDGVLYNKDKTELLFYPNGKTPIVTDESGAVTSGGTVVLPESVVSIRENAFYMCSNLYSVKFNDGLESVGNKAFLKCENLQSIDLPDTVKTIGTDAFSYCNSVKELEIPSSVESIGDYAFFSTASKLEKIVVHKNSEDELTLGKDWIPNQSDSINKKIPVEYIGE